MRHNTYTKLGILLLVFCLQITYATPVFSESVPDDSIPEEAILDVNTPQFWIWDENHELIHGSSNPDTEMVYLASLTKAYTLNAFLENFKPEILITRNTKYNYSGVKIGDTLTYVDAITALLTRSCNTVAENMLDTPPKEGFVTSSGLPAIIEGIRYENQDTPTNILHAFAENEVLIEIYERIYDGRYGHTTYRKWTAYDDLHFNFIKTGFTDQAGRCVFIKTNNHYFLFVGWTKHSELVRDSIAMVRIFEKDHTTTELKSLGGSLINTDNSIKNQN